MPKLGEILGTENKENQGLDQCYQVLEMTEAELKAYRRQVKILQ